MGTQYSSDIQVRRITEGIQFHFLLHIKEPIQIFNMKLFVIAAVCLAATVSADAEPHYGYPYAYHGYGYYPYALPLAPLAKAGVAGHPGAATSYVARSPQGLRGKRSAEPYYGYGFYGYGP